VVRLKFLRLERRLSQRRLAALAHTNQCEVSWIETGRVRPDAARLAAIGAVLGCSPDLLLGHVGDDAGPA
jgi:transcriptional regulator with XRE-family HTH domain